MTLFLWTCCMRFEYLQKSILLNLSLVHFFGFCCWGKNKPGYLPFMPRFIPAGCDPGGRLARKTGTLLPFLLTESISDCALTVGAVNLKIQRSMVDHALFHLPCFSRRIRSTGLVTTMLEAGHVSNPCKRAAVGYWNVIPESHKGQILYGMLVLYAEGKPHLSGVVAAIHAVTVAHGMRLVVVLSWKAFIYRVKMVKLSKGT